MGAGDRRPLLGTASSIAALEPNLTLPPGVEALLRHTHSPTQQRDRVLRLYCHDEPEAAHHRLTAEASHDLAAAIRENCEIDGYP
jgi:hypothetical protein